MMDNIARLKDIIYNSKTNKHKYNISKHPDLYDWIIHTTDFLDENCSFLQRVYCVLNDETPTCEKGVLRKFTENLNLGYRSCSNKCHCFKKNHSSKIKEAKQNMTPQEIHCSNKKREKTNQRKYGVEHVSQSEEIKRKKEQTNQRKYGVNSTFELQVVQEKIKQTNMERYGVENPAQSKEIQDKIKQTNLERYGNTCVLQVPEIRNKARKNNLERYGVEFFHRKMFNDRQENLLSDKTLFENEINSKGILEVSKEYDLDIQLLRKRLNRLNIDYKETYTSYEEFICIFLKNNDIDFEYRNRQLIKPYEIDFVIPEHKIAIEVCGLYWHCEKFSEKHYHEMKRKMCFEKGYSLLTIFSDEIEFKSDIVLSRLTHKLNLNKQKIYARKCIIKKITNKEEKPFLNANHIQGHAKSSIKLGAYYDDELVSVMTFSKNRKFTGSKEEYYEMVRFCSKNNVIGIASKLFSYFTMKYNPAKVISYCDKRWGMGELYYNLGFVLVKDSTPNYWYSKHFHTREHRFKYTKHKLVKNGHDSDKTELQIMNSLGYQRIWDCGTLRFEWINK